MSDPPGVFDSSTVGVSGSGMDFESLLGAFVADLARRWLSDPVADELSKLVADLEACSGSSCAVNYDFIRRSGTSRELVARRRGSLASSITRSAKPSQQFGRDISCVALTLSGFS